MSLFLLMAAPAVCILVCLMFGSEAYCASCACFLILSKYSLWLKFMILGWLKCWCTLITFSASYETRLLYAFSGSPLKINPSWLWAAGSFVVFFAGSSFLVNSFFLCSFGLFEFFWEEISWLGLFRVMFNGFLGCFTAAGLGLGLETSSGRLLEMLWWLLLTLVACRLISSLITTMSLMGGLGEASCGLHLLLTFLYLSSGLAYCLLWTELSLSLLLSDFDFLISGMLPSSSMLGLVCSSGSCSKSSS